MSLPNLGFKELFGKTLKYVLIINLISLSSGFKEFLPCGVLSKLQKHVSFNLLILFFLTYWLFTLDTPIDNYSIVRSDYFVYTLIVSVFVCVVVLLLSKQKSVMFALFFASVFVYFVYSDVLKVQMADKLDSDFTYNVIAICVIAAGFVYYVLYEKRDKGKQFSWRRFFFTPSNQCLSLQKSEFKKQGEFIDGTRIERQSHEPRFPAWIVRGSDDIRFERAWQSSFVRRSSCNNGTMIQEIKTRGT